MKMTCSKCGCECDRTSGNQKYCIKCSPDKRHCSYKATTLICKKCKKEVVRNSARQIYCRSCTDNSNLMSRLVDKKCEKCGIVIEQVYSRTRSDCVFSMCDICEEKQEQYKLLRMDIEQRQGIADYIYSARREKKLLKDLYKYFSKKEQEGHEKILFNLVFVPQEYIEKYGREETKYELKEEYSYLGKELSSIFGFKDDISLQKKHYYIQGIVCGLIGDYKGCLNITEEGYYRCLFHKKTGDAFFSVCRNNFEHSETNFGREREYRDFYEYKEKQKQTGEDIKYVRMIYKEKQERCKKEFLKQPKKRDAKQFFNTLAIAGAIAQSK